MHDPDCLVSVLVSLLPDIDNADSITCFCSVVLNNDDFLTVRAGLLLGVEGTLKLEIAASDCFEEVFKRVPLVEKVSTDDLLVRFSSFSEEANNEEFEDSVPIFGNVVGLRDFDELARANDILVTLDALRLICRPDTEAISSIPPFATEVIDRSMTSSNPRCELLRGRGALDWDGERCDCRSDRSIISSNPRCELLRGREALDCDGERCDCRSKDNPLDRSLLLIDDDDRRKLDVKESCNLPVTI